MNNREVQNLPIISRNSYNFALLQTNVTGRPARGFGPSNINVNGYLRRVNFQFDGNTNTSYNARIRLFNISEIFVGEVQLVTSGFAAEFGDTPGMIMNVVTPSGTNRLNGSLRIVFAVRHFIRARFFILPTKIFPTTKPIFLRRRSAARSFVTAGIFIPALNHSGATINRAR